jgi:hypothetical protein
LTRLQEQRRWSRAARVGTAAAPSTRITAADPAFCERCLARFPLREIGPPEEVVGVMILPAADAEARPVTGVSLAKTPSARQVVDRLIYRP